MDNLFDQQSTEAQHRPKLISSLLQIYQYIKGQLVAWLVLTEEEKIAVGVYIGRKGEGE
jgi:hypothetical protein